MRLLGDRLTQGSHSHEEWVANRGSVGSLCAQVNLGTMRLTQCTSFWRERGEDPPRAAAVPLPLDLLPRAPALCVPRSWALAPRQLLLCWGPGDPEKDSNPTVHVPWRGLAEGEVKVLTCQLSLGLLEAGGRFL